MSCVTRTAYGTYSVVWVLLITYVTLLHDVLRSSNYILFVICFGVCHDTTQDYLGKVYPVCRRYFSYVNHTLHANCKQKGVSLRYGVTEDAYIQHFRVK